MRVAAIFALCMLSTATTTAAAEPAGHALRGLESFDRELSEFITRWEIPGGSLAVSYKGRLVAARGYGLADRDAQAPVTPRTLFRLGSLSKPITAVATLQLVGDGKLDLDTPVLPLLGDDGPDEAAITDSRVRAITVRHLLQHRMGLDREKSGDPAFMPASTNAAKRQNTPMPASCITVLRDGLERQLDFTPGERYAYSNVGYCMLGLIVAHAAGEPYETYVRQRIFAPAGMTGFLLGRTIEKAPLEATYYDYSGHGLYNAMPGVATGKVPAPYGLFSLEVMDGYGNWIGAPVEFLKFMLAVDGARGAPLVGTAQLQDMLARPANEQAAAYYGLGFSARPVSGGLNWWHGGSQPGAEAFAVRTAEGYGWVVAFNMRPKDQGKFRQDLDQTLWRAARAVKDWPSGDLFAEFP